MTIFAPRDPFPFDHLYIQEAWEYERLAEMFVLTGRNAVRFARLHEKKYHPPICDPDEAA